MTVRHDMESGWSEPLPFVLDSQQTLILVFADSKYHNHPIVFKELGEIFPKSFIIGCSTAGQIYGGQVLDACLVVTIIRFKATRLKQTCNRIENSEGSKLAGMTVGEALVDNNLKAVFVLSEGINVNGSELVVGLNASIPQSVLVTGALAGDGNRFLKTWVLDGFDVKESHVVAVGLYGDSLKVQHGSQGGWDIFGPWRKITKSSGNTLYELDGKPALSLYMDYLGELADDLPASALRFPLAVSEHLSESKTLVRTVLGIDRDENSMTFAGDVPEGHYAQLMKANIENLIDGAGRAAVMVSDDHRVEGNMICISVSCVGRRIVLGEGVEDELEAVLRNLPDKCAHVGFYSYGELSPFGNGKCELHNQTMTLTTLFEEDE